MPSHTPAWEVADIFRMHGEAYRKAYNVPWEHIKVMDDIMACRTPRLGGFIEHCDTCGFTREVYHSCGNRHCPKCQTLTKVRWVQARLAELLPVKYFHTVFTLPHELNPLILSNKAVMLDMLFAAVSQTLLAFGRNNLGGRLGFLAILHTWSQILLDHYHIHCVVPGGVLAEDGKTWITKRGTKPYLFPVKALSKVFRGKFTALLEHARRTDRLIYPGQAEIFAAPEGFARLVRTLRSQEWVVYSKAPFAGAEQVLDYLGRYTHRVAVSNNRILHVDDQYVTFSYRDRRNNVRKEMTLQAKEFIRRFLLHVLPQGFMRIRSFGFLANRIKKQSLAGIREILGQNPPEQPGAKTTRELLLELAGVDIVRCPECGKGHMKTVSEIPARISRTGWITSNAGVDSS
jgi:hypothetical protein